MVAIGRLFDVGLKLAQRWSIVAIFTDKWRLLVGYSTLGQCWLNVGPLSQILLITVGVWLAIRRLANVGLKLDHRLNFNL